MKTFFCITVYSLPTDKKSNVKLGPYVTLLEAQTVLLEFLPMINDRYEHPGYLAVITEELYTNDGWIILDEVTREEYEYIR